MLSPNLNGEEPHWLIGALFAIALLGVLVAVVSIAIVI